MSGGLIAGFAESDMYSVALKSALVRVKTLGMSNDDLISLKELTRSRDRRFQKLDRKEHEQFDEA